MPAADYFMWEEHFKYYPPTNLGVQRLLASTLAIKCSSEKKRFNEYDMAPWLKNPLVIESEKDRSKISSINQISEVFDNMKNKKVNNAS